VRSRNPGFDVEAARTSRIQRFSFPTVGTSRRISDRIWGGEMASWMVEFSLSNWGDMVVMPDLFPSTASLRFLGVSCPTLPRQRRGWTASTLRDGTETPCFNNSVVRDDGGGHCERMELQDRSIFKAHKISKWQVRFSVHLCIPYLKAGESQAGHFRFLPPLFRVPAFPRILALGGKDQGTTG
jgi:hypothetical protein